MSLNSKLDFGHSGSLLTHLIYPSGKIQLHIDIQSFHINDTPLSQSIIYLSLIFGLSYIFYGVNQWKYLRQSVDRWVKECFATKWTIM